MYQTAKQERVLYQDLYFVSLPKSFENTQIFFISDIHRRVISDQIIETVQNEVDLVIIGGDLLEKGVSFDRVEYNLLKLKSLGPVFFVWGNNDFEVDINKLEEILLKHGVTILTNRAVHIKSDKGEQLALMGIDDITFERDRLDLALAQCHRKEKFRILVSHNPKVKKQIQEEQQINLVLSGHTHGGQVRILGYGPYSHGGIKVEQDCIFLNSNGYGTSTVPLRLNAKPETHLLRLKKGSHTGLGEGKEKQL